MSPDGIFISSCGFSLTLFIKQQGIYICYFSMPQFLLNFVMLGFAIFSQIRFSQSQSPAIDEVSILWASERSNFDFLCEEIPKFHYNHKHSIMDSIGSLLSQVNRDFQILPSPTLASCHVPQVESKRPASMPTDGHNHDEDSTNLSELISNLPSKVYENCQRTARVIMLSELEKTVMKSKKLKVELTKRLEEFLPHKRDSDSTGEYTGKTKYFKSLHYSRVRIGQRNFINSILLNPMFKEKFQEIFREQIYENCQKARKNENSQVSFEKRKQIITAVINQYQNKFTNFYKTQKKQKEEESANPMVKLEQEADQQPNNFMGPLMMTEENGSNMCMFIVPIVPIPLHPSQYEYYQRSRMINY